MQLLRTTYLSLGSNLGDKLENLQKALEILASESGIIQAVSPIFKSPSWGYEGQEFLNCCIRLDTALNPDELLIQILKTEKSMGRERSNSDDYADRIIDIDILLYDTEIIFKNDLKVPHEHMLNRSFVMVPLSCIAPNVIHPIEKIRIKILAERCMDDCLVEVVNHKLTRPVSLSEKYNYIAIEGNIGAGKTSLANKIATDFNAKIVLERFADNPFLPKFYDDNERYAFPLEMSFLADRYQQLTDDLAQFDLFRNFVVSDYYIFKSLIFAQVTLQHDEFFLYRKMFDIMYKEISKPDLYVYLYQKTDRLLENIKIRGRSYEQNIEPEYLDKIHSGYSSFMKTETGLNTLVIDVTEMDFVNNDDDYTKVIQLIKEA